MRSACELLLEDLRYWGPQLGELTRQAVNRRQRFRQTVLFYVWLTMSHLAGRTRHRPFLMRGSYGELFVRDHSEMLVILETLIREDYDSADMPDTADLVIDVGCNIGSTALWFARRYPSAKIVAVEPDPDTVQIALRNLRAWPNITVVQAAVSDHSGDERLFVARESWSSSTARGSGAQLAVRVPAISLDELIGMGGPRRVLKLDVEGAEHRILRGSTRLAEIEFITGEHHPVKGESYRGMIASLAGFDVRPPANTEDAKQTFTAKRGRVTVAT